MKLNTKYGDYIMIYLSKRAKNYKEKKVEESGNITYIYDDKWVKKRWKKKENKIKALEKNISKLRDAIKKDLTSDDNNTKQIALIISLIDETKERIGNKESAEESKHYGVSTWLKKHVSFSGGNAKIKYVGKSGVKQEKTIKNKTIAKALKDVLKDKKPNDKIFDVTPKSVNKYLEKFKISAKDIRGAAANSRFKEELKKQRKGKLPTDEKEKEKKLKEELNKALESVSKELGHEPSTLKNQYVLPKTIDNYLTRGKIASKYTSTIIAIMAPKNIIKKLKNFVDEETQPSDKLHVTLIFLGSDLDDTTKKAVIKATERVCSRHEPLSMSISGVGKFTKGDNGIPYYVIPNAKGLNNFQADLENTISNFVELPSEYGWVPHMTMGYSADDNPDLPQLKDPISWKATSVVVIDGEKMVAEIPLGKKFKLSKRADLTPKTTFQVIVEPFDPAVDKALKKLPQDITKNVTKVVVHQEVGPGQLGHVEMGPNKDPREIHIFKNRIIEQVKNMFGTMTPTPQQLEQATEQVLIEVLTHEGVHIGPEKTQEQILDPSYRFRGEGETETQTSQRMKQMFPQAFAKLEKIRKKYLPLYRNATPNIDFIILSDKNKEYDLIRTGINSILNPEGINSIIKHNSSTEFNTIEGVIKLAEKQYENKELITGKVKKNSFPRNFGKVEEGLYRGGFIENTQQLQALKDLGVERVISLHNNPEITRMCNKIGLEHIIAPLEEGKPEEYGRNILGDNISDFLLQKPTYIHCWFGADRTGGVVARFRTENGWSNKDAYLEAKKYGFKDVFVDLIDWFCELNDEPIPVDTNKIRKLLKSSPYKNPEIMEQNAAIPASPTDAPFRFYDMPSVYQNEITSPDMSISPLSSYMLSDDGYMNKIVNLVGNRGEAKPEQPWGGLAEPPIFYR